ncbi:MAG: DUF1998 domain-containing protein [Oscillatoriales cyanobacterium C42_A2020_001]|nr:DUF1998 domain-containing protein [Leptolyngbyaceae cyanobacterium C42_A2020_001]
MKAKTKRPAAGEIRQSQIISTFGPGSMVDLPNHSVLIGGLNHWKGDRRRIYEDRLAGRVSELLGVKQIAMYAPPVDEQDPKSARSGITSFVFPIWFLAQMEETWETPDKRRYRTRPLLPWGSLVKGKYLTLERKKVPVVPVRFVQACVNGHISDIDWYRFVHTDSPNRNCRGQLWLDEGGSGNDFVDIFVRCETCKARRPLSDATVPNGKVLGSCEGHRPWLGPAAKETCVSQVTGKPEYNRLLVRSASNAYFAQTLSVISLPDSDEAIRKVVDLVYEDFLKGSEGIDDIKFYRRKNEKVMLALEGFSDDAVWAEVKRRQSGSFDKPKSIKQVEIETLLSQPDEVGEDVPEGDFYARTRKLESLHPLLSSKIDRIVLVHRLREVIAQIGFTRFEAVMPDVDGELSLPVQPAALDIEPTWVPAIENRGEGIFISFKKEAIENWLKRDAVQNRGRSLYKGFDEWRSQRGIDPDKVKFLGLPYVMLHSLSHLLITAVSLECGYAASAIRERIYTGEAGYGILLYTGTSGSEGTLGGLVQVGKRIEYHLMNALEMGKLCSNDPVCAQHQPNNQQENRFLHGAACHGCLLIAEPSCERRNEFLDRALVTDTVEGLGAEFFEVGGL